LMKEEGNREQETRDREELKNLRKSLRRKDKKKGSQKITKAG